MRAASGSTISTCSDMPYNVQMLPTWPTTAPPRASCSKITAQRSRATRGEGPCRWSGRAAPAEPATFLLSDGPRLTIPKPLEIHLIARWLGCEQNSRSLLDPTDLDTHSPSQHRLT